MKTLKRKYFVSYMMGDDNNNTGFGNIEIYNKGKFDATDVGNHIGHRNPGMTCIVIYYKFLGWTFV